MGTVQTGSRSAQRTYREAFTRSGPLLYESREERQGIRRRNLALHQFCGRAPLVSRGVATQWLAPGGRCGTTAERYSRAENSTSQAGSSPGGEPSSSSRCGSALAKTNVLVKSSQL